MNEAVVSYAARAAEKLRRHKVTATHISVFMHTNAHNADPSYSNGASGSFLEATNDTGELVTLAVRLAGRVWRDGFRYAKAGVILTELLPEAVVQHPAQLPLGRGQAGRRALDEGQGALARDSGGREYLPIDFW